jgi:hypothetical protein
VRAAAEDEQKQAQVAAAEAGRLDLPFESDLPDSMQTFSGGSTPGAAAAGSSVIGPSESTQLCDASIHTTCCCGCGYKLDQTRGHQPGL